jgi:putative ATP-dependent endonuclease of OLD family
MRISRIHIKNFRNFHNLDIALGQSVVILGENRIGKSNLLHAIRLVLDPSLPDSARQLRIEDFWDGLSRPLSADSQILISVDISDFEDDEDLLAVLAEHLVQPQPMVARLTYFFGSIPGLKHPPVKDDDFEFSTYGGGRPENRIGYDLRKRIPLEVLHALRDVEGDLARWTRSPLRPLVDRAQASIEQSELQDVAEEVSNATAKVADLGSMKELATRINEKLKRMSGEAQTITTVLGLSSTDPEKLLRSLRILFDDATRDISEASLGTANVLYLALRSLELDALVKDGSREHTFFAIEEPEAHLHPHLQRLVFRNYLSPRQPSVSDQTLYADITYLLTTHSPHVASVTPVKSLVLLRRAEEEASTVGVSGANIALTAPELDDIERYLDVSRAECLFAKGILLVEGDAEKYLIPVLAARAGFDLDSLGITICSVSGTNFVPYLKFFGPNGLNIPFAVITDMDPQENGTALGYDRVADQIIPTLFGPFVQPSNGDRLAVAEKNGVFLSTHTFEVDLFRSGYYWSIAKTMEDTCSVQAAVDRSKARATNKVLDDADRYIKDIEYVGKGRFAQRLGSYILESKCRACPEYLLKAINHVISRIS